MPMSILKCPSGYLAKEMSICPAPESQHKYLNIYPIQISTNSPIKYFNKKKACMH